MIVVRLPCQGFRQAMLLVYTKVINTLSQHMYSRSYTFPSEHAVTYVTCWQHALLSSLHIKKAYGKRTQGGKWNWWGLKLELGAG